jgi:hypothetical protein
MSEHQCVLYPLLHEMGAPLFCSDQMGPSCMFCTFFFIEASLRLLFFSFLDQFHNGNKFLFYLIKLKLEDFTKSRHCPCLVQVELIFISWILHPWPVLFELGIPIISIFTLFHFF